MSERPRSITGLSITQWALILATGIGPASFGGCANAPAAPATVNVATREAPCKADIQRPTFPADTLTGDEDFWTIGTTLWADRLARKAYELQVETALNGCTAPNK